MSYSVVSFGGHGRKPLVLSIVADTESDITSLTGYIHDNERDTDYHALPGSIAYTADRSVLYTLSPSLVWTKNTSDADEE